MASFNPSDYNHFLYLVKFLHSHLENTGGNKMHICIFIYNVKLYICIYSLRLSSINAVS